MLAETLKNFVEESLGLLLGVGFTELIIQVSGTVILFLIVRKYFWSSITHYLEVRKAHMANEIKEAELLKNEAFLDRDQASKELEQLRSEVSNTLSNAKQRAIQERHEILEEAKKDALRLKLDAEAEIQMEVEKAQQEMKNEIIKVASAIATKVIDQEIDEKKHKKLIDEATSEVSS